MSKELYNPLTYVQITFWSLFFAMGNIFIKWRLKLKKTSTRSFFVVHAFANFVIVCLSFENTLFTLKNPLESCICKSTGCSHPALFVMLGIHISHMLVDFYTLTLIDYLHHILSCFLSGYFVLVYRSGPIVEFCLMWACGTPGKIDYLMLYLVKTNRISKITEKKYNTLINNWIRAPFLVMFGSIIYTCWMSGRCEKDEYGNNEMPFWVLMCFIVFLSLNGVFFNMRVTVSYGKALADPIAANKIRANKSELVFPVY